MLVNMTYILFTLFFCIPPIIFLWARKDFLPILAGNKKEIIITTMLITLYGSFVWPIAERLEFWVYNPKRISGVMIYTVLLDDIIWWVCVSFLFSSFIAISAHYEEKGADIVMREARSFGGALRSAFAGVGDGFLERNICIEIACAAAVCIAGLFFRITPIEWLVVIFNIALVLGLEYTNTSIEKLSAKKEFDPNIKIVKDLSAAGVTIVALLAFISGIIIFVPYIRSLW